MSKNPLPIVVRSGLGSPSEYAVEGFTDSVSHCYRVPRTMVGWQCVTYKGLRYRLGGGIRTPYNICLNNPIRK